MAPRNKNDGRSSEAARSARKAASSGWRSALKEGLPKGITFAELWELYLAALRSRDASVPDAVSIGNLYLLPAFGDMRVSDISMADIVAWVVTMRGALSATYLHKIHTYLRASLEIARSRGVVAANPASKLPPGTLPRHEVRPDFDAAAELLSVRELVYLISHPEVPLHRRTRYALMALTGTRLNEALSLRWRHLESDTPLPKLTISVSYSTKKRRETAPKTKKHRTVPIHPRLLMPLLEEMRTDGFWNLFSRPPSTDDFLAPTPAKSTGLPRRVDPSLALAQWHDDLATVGLRQNRRLHSLRHWFITTLTALAVPEMTIRSMTHPPRKGDAFHIYVFTQWEAKCKAIQSIQERLLTPSEVQRGL